MSRRATYGFEVQGNPDSSLVQGTPSFITGLVVGTGTSVRALHCPPSGNDGTSGNCYVHVDGGVGTYGRAYFYRAHIAKTGTPASGQSLFLVRNHHSSGSSTGYVAVRLHDDSTLSLVTSDSTVNPVQVGSRSTAITDGAVHRIEMMVRPVSAGVVDCELRLDGTVVASGTSVAAVNMNNSTEVDFGRVAQAVSNTATTPFSWVDVSNVTVDVDNVAINDDLVPTGQTAGTQGAQDSYPGDGTVYMLLPTADSFRSNFVTQTGGGTTNLFDAVNNDPPVGDTGAATFISAPGSTGGTYRAALQTLNARSITGTVVVAQPISNIGVNGGSSYTAYLQAYSNPADTELSHPFNFGSLVGAYPAGWTPYLGIGTHLPTIDPAVTPVIQFRSTGSGGPAVDFLGLTLEVSTPPVRRSLTMLV